VSHAAADQATPLLEPGVTRYDALSGLLVET